MANQSNPLHALALVFSELPTGDRLVGEATLIQALESRGVPRKAVKRCLETLRVGGFTYEPRPGIVGRLVD